ncbi:MAG: hypothetical protein ABSB68_15975 [Acidimicrobiales bacterium]
MPTHHQRVTHPQIATVGTAYDATEVRSSGAIYLKVCWSSDAPVARDGAYLTALFPPVSPFGGAGAYAVTRQLNLGAADASDYVLQDSYQAFLSGILLGVAGGAMVALIQELVAPFRSRRELAPPEPGG